MSNISKISELATEMASMGFLKEADEILALAAAQQLDIFEPEKKPSNEESFEGEADRFNLDDIDFEAILIPSYQVEPRKKIIHILLREHLGRSKQDIIDEVLKISTDPYSFEHQTRNYRQAYPELNAELPQSISPKQVRMPGIEPDIRFLPDPEETEQAREKAREYKEEYSGKVKKLREEYPKEKLIERIRENRPYYGDRDIPDNEITWEMQRIIDKELKRPEDPDKIKIDVNISPELYNKLQGELREAYKSAELKVGELNQLIGEAKDDMPPEPPPVNPESFTKLDQYIEDLKYRVYYNSYRVLSGSAGYTIFGASTGEGHYYNSRRSDLLFFSIKEEQWLDDPESFKDYMEKSPQAEYLGGWRQNVARPSEWAKSKKDDLERYEESIDKAIASYKRGLRFLKRLNRMLDKEIDNRFGETDFYNKEVILYIERHYKDQLDIIYQKVINSLEGEVDDASRSSYYRTEHKGAFIQSYYGGSREEREDRSLSMFDIDALFHNKIKMYEVVNNFASLILTIINRTLRNVRDQTFKPIITQISVDIHKKLVLEMTGFNEEDLWRIASPELDPAFTSGRGPTTERRKTKEYNVMSISKKGIDQIFNNWTEFNKDGIKNYQSISIYPRFIIKDPEVSKVVEDNFKRQIVFGIIKNMTGTHSHSIKNEIASMIDELLNDSKIKISGQSNEEVLQSFSMYNDMIFDKIKNNIRNKNKFHDHFSRRFGASTSWETAVFADDSGISEEYKELIHILKEKNISLTKRRSRTATSCKAGSEAYSFELANITVDANIDAKQEVADNLSGRANVSSNAINTLMSSLKVALKYFMKEHQAFMRLIKEDNDLVKTIYSRNLTPALSLSENDPYFPQEELNEPRRESDDDLPGDPWPPEARTSSDEDQTEMLFSPNSIGRNSITYISNNLDKFFTEYPLFPEIDEDNFQELGLQWYSEIYSEEEGDLEQIELRKKHIKYNYDNYICRAKEINKKRENIKNMFGPAVKQLESIAYTVYYSNVFKDRMTTFGNVGPRGISKKYRELSKTLKTKDLPLMPLVKHWERQMVQSIDKTIDYLLLSDGETDLLTGRVPGVTEEVSDQAREFYGKSYNGIRSLDPPHAAAILIAKRLNITNYNMFEKIMKICRNEFHSTGRYQRNFGYDEFKKFIPVIFNDTSGLKNKVVKLYKISDYAHNRGVGLSMSFFVRTLEDPNFKNFGANASVDRYFAMCAKLARFGGLAKIKREYKEVISTLSKNKMLSRGFYTRLRNIYRVCKSGMKIRPNLEGLEGEALSDQVSIRQSIEEVDTDLTAIQEYSTLEEYNRRVIPKDKNLFKLNWEVKSKNFRFKVLRTYDPRHFKIGAETGCCQRLGGIGEKAAIDSYINPLAGVVILEIFKEDRAGVKRWNLASQSYFHYVPADNGYILDNVEHNMTWAGKIWETTGYSKEKLYAMLAKKIKDTYDVKYFSIGKRFSKIDDSEFSSLRLGHDPRDFVTKYTYQGRTDWSSSSSINLLDPKFDLPEIPEVDAKKKRKEKISKLHYQTILSKYSNNNDNHSYRMAALISNLPSRIDSDKAEEMEELEQRYFSNYHAQDSEDILDDMDQPGAAGVAYVDDKSQKIKGYLYGYQLVYEDEILHENIDLEDFECFVAECDQDIYSFAEDMIQKAKDGEIFYISNFLIDKAYRMKIIKIIEGLLEEVRGSKYRYIAFDALSDTHRLLMSGDRPNPAREKRFGITVLGKIEKDAPMFIARVDN